MPRTEARIFTSIWRDEHFLALAGGAQRLYMFLLSQDDLAYCGVMPLRERRWASKAAGLSLADVEQDLKALETAGRMFVVTDEETGELLIRSMMRRDSAWKQPNLLKQARESAQTIESMKIRAILAAELRRLPIDESPSEQVRTLVAEFIEDLEQGNPYPSAYPPANPSDEGSGDSSGDSKPEDYACAREFLLLAPSSFAPSSIAPTDLPARDRKLGTRLPDDFAVTAEMVAWARQHAPHVDGKRETERFCDHWRSKPGKDGRKLDWLATWRNWMRTAEDRQGPRERPGTSASPASTTDQRVAGWQALKDGPGISPGPARTIEGRIEK
jgi:hypothetical protein